ncbi:MAG: hypothetical protein ACOH5I_03535 [Oligoflexus sp.]
MEIRSTSSFFRLVLVILSLGMPLGSQVIAQSISEDNQHLILDQLGKINTYSPLEPAFSRGAIGFTFGLGWQPRIFDDANLQQWGNPAEYQDIRQETMINAYLVKGFSWPINIGVSAGQIPATTIKRLGGHAQWTMFQGFKLPSLAARFAFNRLSGFQATELASSQASLLTDYSFLRYFTIFIGYSLQYHQASYRDHIPGWNISRMSQSSQIVKNWWDQHQIIGINIRFLPPYFQLTVEHQRFQENQEQWLGKLSFGI